MPLSDSMRPAVDSYVRDGWIHSEERYRSMPAFIEARLAHRLLSEESLGATAGSLGVAISTVRNQLKAVFEKTDTHSQGQRIALIALIARLATPRSPDTGLAHLHSRARPWARTG